MKRPGHCTLCEKPVREVLQHRDGEPIRLGEWFSNAWRVTFLLSDKTEADITFCEACLPDIPSSKKQIWDKVLERFQWEEKNIIGTPSKAVSEFHTHIKKLKLGKEIGRILWSEA